MQPSQQRSVLPRQFRHARSDGGLPRPAFGYADASGSNLFLDDDTSILENDIDKPGRPGVTRGCSPPANDRFCPSDKALRDQMASFLGRALGLIPEVPPPRPATTTTSSTTTTTQPNYDPSYPTVCIPPPPPDLDCGEIPHRDFTVLQPDPHRFDGDKDGVGCET